MTPSNIPMRRTPWLAVIAVTPALLLAGEKQTCPMGPFDFGAGRDLQAATYHRLSIAAETVAPSRHRPSEPPSLISPYPNAVNIIDGEIFGKMKKDLVPAATVSSDTEFLRRVTLDLTGAIPDPAAVQSFLADTSADKRVRLIDHLLSTEGFTDRWTMWFGDLVQNVQQSSSSREYPQGRNTYYAYIRDSIRGGKAYDQMVREILAAKGDSFVNGGADYWVRQIQPNGPIQDTYDNLAAHSGEKFLGMPMQCISCHNGFNHLELVNTYLKGKNRADFWGNAAFFARTRSQRGTTDPANPNIVSLAIEDMAAGNYNLNTTSGNKTPRTLLNGSPVVAPAFLLTGEGPRPGEAWRDAYGRILTAHPQFARATVNYIWKEMFGLGIVEPVNNFDLARLDPATLAAGASLQPTHPALLRDLATQFAASGYNLRWLLKTIAMSNAYQLSSHFTAAPWNESWTPYFARHLPQRLPAEQLLDAITKATSVPVSFTVSGLGMVNQAIKLPDTLESRNTTYGRFLDDFGRGNRDDDPRSNDGSISQALSLMNNATVLVNRVHKATANSTVAKTLLASTDPAAITDTLYLSTLSRYPTAAEKTKAVAFLKVGTLSQRTEDLQWVLLNSVEFLFN